MTIPEMLSQSAMLTVLGMGVVFGFLIILIIFMKLVEILVRNFGADKKEGNASTASPAAPAPAGKDQTVIAAIATAVSEKHKK